MHLQLRAPWATVSCEEHAGRGGHRSLGSPRQWHSNMEEKQCNGRWYRDATGLGAAVVTASGSGVSCVIQARTWPCTVRTCLQSITQTCPKTSFLPCSVSRALQHLEETAELY